MKWTISFLVLFSTNSFAQPLTGKQVKAYSDYLVQHGFLTLKGQQMLLEEIKKGEIEVEQPSTVKSITYSRTELTKGTILQFCSAAITTERTHRIFNNKMQIDDNISPKESIVDSLGRTYTIMDGIGGNKEYMDCISPQTSIFGFTRSKTLHTFLQSGLIDEKIFNDCAAALKSIRLRDEVDLLRYMVDRSTYYTYYEFNKAEQENYISRLVQMNILSEQGKQNLLSSYKNFALKSIPEILRESPRYTLVDLHSYPPDPKITYPVIFESFKKVFPSFNYSKLFVELLEEKEDDLIRQDVRLSFYVDTDRYVHTFFHDYRKRKLKRGETDDEPARVDEDFHKGINKWLSDIGSPFRLYTITVHDDDGDEFGDRSVGLLMLKQGEDSMITTDGYLMSSETFDQRLSRRNIEKMIKELSERKFFTHLSAAEMSSAREKIAGTDINSLEEALLQFPKTIVLFDWETGNLENPYEELTREFVNASRGAFTVSNIIDGYKKASGKVKKIKYGFTMNGKKYEKMLDCEDDWLDPEFFQLLKTALEENKVDGKIYYCIDNGQESGYIFLTTAQYQYIKEAFPDLLKVL